MATHGGDSFMPTCVLMQALKLLGWAGFEVTLWMTQHLCIILHLKKNLFIYLFICRAARHVGSQRVGS